MIYPSLEELTQNNKYNRYVLCIAASKCARMVTEEYIEQREIAEKLIAGKETDKSINALIQRDVRDEKPVKTALKRLYQGEYRIRDDSLEENE